MLLDENGKIWKLNIEESELQDQHEERILQVSSVEGREVHCVAAGYDFTVAICKNHDASLIKNLGDLASDALEVSSHRKVGSSRLEARKGSEQNLNASLAGVANGSRRNQDDRHSRNLERENRWKEEK